MKNIAIFGAGGRAGRAVISEARMRGHHVTAVVRDPGGYDDVEADGVRLVRGDVTDRRGIPSVVRGHDAVVHAATPFKGPEQGFASLDPEFYVKAADALLHGLADTGVPRLLVVGLFANLLDAHGRQVMDDPAVFPPEIRPFAAAHSAGVDWLRAQHGEVDWLVLTPPARLEIEAPRTGRYQVGGDAVPRSASARLSYADLAVAMIDEIETPRHHRTRISVFN